LNRRVLLCPAILVFGTKDQTFPADLRQNVQHRMRRSFLVVEPVIFHSMEVIL
jgi:hypothetical protein